MRSPNAIFVPMLGLLCTTASLSCSTAKTQAPGEVVVVVTSDMVVPEDIDTLTWSVTIGDAGTPFKDGSYPLQGSQQLPATLAIVSGHDTPGAVRIQLEGLRKGTPRVHREADLSTVPDDGKVRQLVMPLNWLCTHDANPSLSCEAGQTCQAGACVSSAIDASSLVAYSAPDSACFDVHDCFPASLSRSPPPNPNDPIATVTCSISTEEGMGVGTDVNVALIVNTSQIGNYGACGTEGFCLIPLSRGAPEGWTPLTDDGGAPLIGLPPAVCSDLENTVIGVLVAPTTSCPQKTLESPTCPSPENACIKASGVCPPDWGQTSWQGYTCSGSTPPPGVRVGSCSPPPAAPDAGIDTEDGGANGRWCCGLGTTERPPDAGPLLIDNMTGGPEIKITPPLHEVAGEWFTAYGDPHASVFPATGGLFTYTPVLTDGGPMNAACLRSPKGFTSTSQNAWLLEGFNFAYPKNILTPTGAPFDVTLYTGMRFLAWSSSNQTIRVAFPDQNTENLNIVPASTCNLDLAKNPQAGQCADDFGQNLPLTDVWTEYFVYWNDLSQQGWGAQFSALDKQRVFATLFQVLGTQVSADADGGYYVPPVDFCVSQIYFTDDEPGADGGDDATRDGG
jgi:hypothetical protein